MDIRNNIKPRWCKKASSLYNENAVSGVSMGEDEAGSLLTNASVESTVEDSLSMSESAESTVEDLLSMSESAESTVEDSLSTSESAEPFVVNSLSMSESAKSVIENSLLTNESGESTKVGISYIRKKKESANSDDDTVNKKKVGNTEDNIIDNDSLIEEGFGKIFYARRRGKGHAIEGKVCQDYCLVKKLSNDIRLIAVADGHGGSQYIYSDIGSRLACEKLAEFIYDYYNKHIDNVEECLQYFTSDSFKKSYIQYWKQAVIDDYDTNRASEKGDVELRQKIKIYGTTLLFALVFSEDIIVGQVGDGAILMFDNNRNKQLYKRHLPKYNSSTNSLSSSRAEYGFFIERFDRNLWPYILISTDGIYDKLNQGESFLVYGAGLVEQASGKKKLENPFDFCGVDVSEKTHDDCSIALLINDIKIKNLNLKDLNSFGYEQVTLERRKSGIDIYKAKRGKIKYEVHVVNKLVEDKEDFWGYDFVYNPVDKINISTNLEAYEYKLDDESISLQELLEQESHYEKAYVNNSNDEDVEYDEHDGSFWLSVYENMLDINSYFSTVTGFDLKEYWMDVTYISSNGNIKISKDAIKKNSTMNNNQMKKFFAYFKILGKLIYRDKEVPLYKTVSMGINILRMDPMGEGKLLGRVICKKVDGKDIFGLYNLSDRKWLVGEIDRREVENKTVLTLNQDCSFAIQELEIMQLEETIKEEDVLSDSINKESNTNQEIERADEVITEEQKKLIIQPVYNVVIFDK